MADPDVKRLHGYHSVGVRTVITETADTRSFVLEVPEALESLFDYRAGQFCTFRVHVDGRELLRCYSMSSAPETDPALTVTVKRVPGGAVSNWLIDNVSPGDTLELTKPAGVFTVPPGTEPLVAFCGGSGVTPVMSIIKSTLATTDRDIRVLYANRDGDSVIFAEDLARLARANPDRLELHHHLDCDLGYLDAAEVWAFAEASGGGARFFLCGPPAFMGLVEESLEGHGVPQDRIHLERFGEQAGPVVGEPHPAPDDPPLDGETIEGDGTDTVVVILDGVRTEVEYHGGDTLLQTARSGGLRPPFSCEAGNCATCMAQIHEGSATMRTNNALDPDEVEEGWVLTCQAIPHGPVVVVEYESF